MPISVSPYAEALNDKRSDSAASPIKSFVRDFGEVDGRDGLGSLARQNTIDLLANIAHFCDRNGMRLMECMHLAEMHYLDETDLKGQQFKEH
jgi:hypothetical protein